MKKIVLNRLLVVLVIGAFFFASCTKEQSDVRLNPKLASTQVLNLKSDSATIVSFVVASGSGFSERGVVYDVATAPTTDKSKVIDTETGNSATFTVKLGGLSFATNYFARAYAITANGTIYGKEITFTTLPVLATVTTDSITSIAGTSATGGGNITNDGGSAVTARGICFGLTPNPTITGSKTTDGTGSGLFVSSMTKLNGLTTYHVRAYATNTIGTSYGNDVHFITLVSTRLWYVPGDYVTASYPGSTFGNWDPANSPQVKSLATAPDNIEGYVYMANTTNGWKFATLPNWNGPNYGDGGSGKLDANGGNFSSPMGYYKINVNAAANPMTYTAVATVWGVIGDASPNGWTDETALTYNPALTTWNGGMHLTVGSFKFRANHSWDYNYGSTAANATLDAGGSNIANALEADYAFTLDLSHPWAYTYSANRWGVIGDATPDGWNSDQNMTWDAVNHVFKVTLNMVVGAFKFRANDAWDINYGGANLNALTAGGDNIPITVAGNYTITFDPWAHSATLTMN
jgi:starch-binding outer membrane protein SusE/F